MSQGGNQVDGGGPPCSGSENQSNPSSVMSQGGYQGGGGGPPYSGSEGGHPNSGHQYVNYPPRFTYPNNQQQYFPHLQHRTIMQGSQAFPVIMTDDLVSGTRQNGSLSPVRRFFLLLCTFDLLFTAFLWIIAILVTGKELVPELQIQVLHYDIHNSMFDCLFISASRFLICMVTYGVLDVSHWWPITLSTAGTVAFLIAKVLMYKWHDDPITYDVMLVLLSFILAWGEVWFFDFRLIPLEEKAKEIWTAHSQSLEEGERAPLLGSQAAGGMLQRYMEGSTLYEGSVANFYSPMESPNDSDVEDDSEISNDSGIRIPRRFRRKRDHPMSEQEKEYKKKGEEALNTAWTNLNSDGWVLQKRLDNGDFVQAKTINKKKVFKVTGTVDISPRLLLEELFYRIEQVPQWNPTLIECRTIQPIDEFTDVSYQVCAEAAGGVVSSRDFVNLRHWSLIDGVFVSAGISIKHPAMPPQPKRTRGENGACCWAMRPVEGNPNSCLFQGIIDTDLKGWIPQSVIDKALSGAQLEYLENIRKRAMFITSEETDHNTSINSCSEAI